MVTLIVGATGMLGTEICRQLSVKGLPLRGLVREGSVGEDVVRGMGVEIVRGDLKDPRSLRAACQGTGAVVTTANSILRRRKGDSIWSVDRDGHLSLVAAARAAGVAHFIYVSIMPQVTDRTPFVRCKRRVEEEVRGSGMTWTVLQPAPFMEVSLSPLAGWDLGHGRVTLFGSGTVPCNYISLVDVAQYAVLALERPVFRDRDVVLGGPEAVAPLDVIREFEAVAGRKFSVRHLPMAIPRLLGLLLRPLNPGLSSILGMAAGGGVHGEVIDMGPVLELARPPSPLTSVRDHAKRVMAREARSVPEKLREKVPS